MADEGDGPRPGFYLDPWRQAQLRYWDGRAWTPHVADDRGAQAMPSKVTTQPGPGVQAPASLTRAPGPLAVGQPGSQPRRHPRQGRGQTPRQFITRLLAGLAIGGAITLLLVVVAGTDTGRKHPDGFSGAFARPHAGLARAVLGGSMVAWDRGRTLGAAGIETPSSATHTYSPCEGEKHPQWSVDFDPAAVLVERGHCSDSKVSPRSALAEARKYFPSNASRPLGTFRNNEGERVHLYFDSHLAKLVKAERNLRASSHTCSGGAARPGTFSFVVARTYWALAIGACP